ncbi:MAG TPA: S8 family serine peptidase, partial [Candidatus Paceibacterota bacterium]|nr:S8 family serine peptidase [Candidatus Paceibacterota bacterium]
MNRFSFLAAWALVASPWVLLAQGNSCKNVASTTPDYSCWNGTNCLDYLEPAPIGIDARYAWRFPGGRGAGIKVFDVTGSYRFSHEDLPAPFFPLNPSLPPADYEHETGAVGIIVACDNGYGVTGIANQAQVGFQRPLDKRADDDERDLFSRGISNAVSMLNPGDVIWISGDMSGAPTNDAATAVCAHKNYGHVPIEWEQWEFEAISAATRKGIIFCEAAGNGEMNLDDDRYEGKFDRSARDSGAIIVGAGQSPRFGFTRRYDPDCLLLPLVERAPHYWCGYGTRVDVQGRGDSISTTGIGSNVLPTGWAANSNELYTAGYGGTSGATPMVAGAVACIQGFLKAQGRPVLTPVEMRDLLVATGIPQQQADVTGDGVVDVRHIGPLPNLRAAINALLPTSLAAGHFNNDSYEDLAIGRIDAVLMDSP